MNTYAHARASAPSSACASSTRSRSLNGSLLLKAARGACRIDHFLHSLDSAVLAVHSCFATLSFAPPCNTRYRCCHIGQDHMHFCVEDRAVDKGNGGCLSRAVLYWESDADVEGTDDGCPSHEPA